MRTSIYKLLIFFIACCGLTGSRPVQTDFDSKIKSLAISLSEQIQQSDLKKIGVLGFFTETGEETNLGQLITEDFSVYLTSPSFNYEVYDRKHLDLIIEENKLGSERRLANQKTYLKLGELEGIEGIVTGTYSIIGESIRIRAKLIKGLTGQQVGAAVNNLTMDDNIKQYLGMSYGRAENASRRGYSTPLSSNESYNNPLTVHKDCDKLDFGDFCFSNTTRDPLNVYFVEYRDPDNTGSWIKSVDLGGDKPQKVKYDYILISLQPNQTQCIYKTGSGPASYFIYKEGVNVLRNGHGSFRRGQVYIEKCKSRTFTIK